MIYFDSEKKLVYKKTQIEGEDGTTSTVPKMILNCNIILQCMGFDSSGNFAYFVKLDGQQRDCMRVFTSTDISKKVFTESIFSLGFNFKGSDSDIADIFIELQKSEAASQKMLFFKRFSGRFTKQGYNLVVYRNGIYDISNAKFYPYEQRKDIRLDDGTVVLVEDIPTNIKLFPVYQEPKGEYITMTPSDFFSKKMIPLWKKNPYSILIFAWYLGSLHIEEVLKYSQLGFFPLIFVSGMAGQGKTQMMRMMNRIVGFDHEAQNWEIVTPYVEQNDSAFINGFPIHRDEYRGDGKYTEAKNGFVRSYYLRAGTPKGRGDLTTVLLPVNATLAISGEGRPKEAAMKRRFVPFSFNISAKHSSVDYHAFLKDSLDWAQIMPSIYKKGGEIEWKTFPEKYMSYLKEFTTPTVEFPERFAILATIFDLFIGGDIEATIKKQINYYIPTVNLEFSQGDHGEEFFESIHLQFLKKGMYQKKFPTEKYIPASAYIKRFDDKICVYFSAIFPMYQEQMRANDTKDFKGVSEMRSIFKEKYFARTDDQQRFNGSANGLSCVSFPKEKCPMILENIMSTIEAAEKAEIINYSQANGFE